MTLHTEKVHATVTFGVDYYGSRWNEILIMMRLDLSTLTLEKCRRRRAEQEKKFFSSFLLFNLAFFQFCSWSILMLYKRLNFENFEIIWCYTRIWRKVKWIRQTSFAHNRNEGKKERNEKIVWKITEFLFSGCLMYNFNPLQPQRRTHKLLLPSKYTQTQMCHACSRQNGCKTFFSSLFHPHRSMFARTHWHRAGREIRGKSLAFPCFSGGGCERIGMLWTRWWRNTHNETI